MESRGKRILDGDYEQQPERKRPALASVIVGALKVDSLQKLCSSLEPVLRRVVSEELEHALTKRGLARINGRSSPRRIEGPDGRNLQLQFRSRLSLPLFTGGKVEWEQGGSIHVVLVDANTGCDVTFGPESSVKLDVVVLEGDFNIEDDEDWSREEFESHVVKEREGKRPLLTGDLQVRLKEGVGTIGDITFTDNSSWIRSQKFRLGLKVSLGFCEGIRIREAKTKAFTVKDRRGELYQKHYPPALNDDVWRLEKIAKDGPFHKRLNDAGISTVEDFLRLVVRDSQRLQTILGSSMPNKKWEALIEHAKTCVLSGKHYVYYPDDMRNEGVVFNNIHELSGLISGGQYCSADSLTEDQKVFVDSLVKKAYDNWGQFIEYDGKSLLSFKQTKRSSASRNELLMGPIDSLDHQMPLSRLPVSVPSDQSLVNSVLPVGAAGFNDNLEPRYPSHSHFENSSSRTQFDSTSYAPHDQLIGNAHDTHNTRNDESGGLAHGLPQSSTSGFQTMSSSVQASNLNQFDDWSHNRDKGVDDFISEEEIQNLMKGFSMEIQASMNVPEDGYSFPPDMLPPSPNYGYDEDHTFSGKAVVEWRKIKATMRWAFFIRKKAAEKRAQLIELDDEGYMLGECF